MRYNPFYLKIDYGLESLLSYYFTHSIQQELHRFHGKLELSLCGKGFFFLMIELDGVGGLSFCSWRSREELY